MRLALCGGGDCEAAVLSHGLHYGYAFRRPPHPQTEEEQDEPEMALSRDRPGDGRFCLTGGFGPNGTATGATGPPPPIGMMLQGISLTSDQQTAIDAIMKSHQQTAQPLLDQLHGERQALTAKLLSAGEVSLSDLGPLQQESAQPSRNCKRMHLRLRWRSSWC